MTDACWKVFFYFIFIPTLKSLRTCISLKLVCLITYTAQWHSVQYIISVALKIIFQDFKEFKLPNPVLYKKYLGYCFLVNSKAIFLQVNKLKSASTICILGSYRNPGSRHTNTNTNNRFFSFSDILSSLDEDNDNIFSPSDNNNFESSGFHEESSSTRPERPNVRPWRSQGSFTVSLSA